MFFILSVFKHIGMANSKFKISLYVLRENILPEVMNCRGVCITNQNSSEIA